MLRWCGGIVAAVRRRCHGGAASVLRRCGGIVTAVQRHCCGVAALSRRCGGIDCCGRLARRNALHVRRQLCGGATVSLLRSGGVVAAPRCIHTPASCHRPRCGVARQWQWTAPGSAGGSTPVARGWHASGTPVACQWHAACRWHRGGAGVAPGWHRGGAPVARAPVGGRGAPPRCHWRATPAPVAWGAFPAGRHAATGTGVARGWHAHAGNLAPVQCSTGVATVCTRAEIFKLARHASHSHGGMPAHVRFGFPPAPAFARPSAPVRPSSIHGDTPSSRPGAL